MKMHFNAKFKKKFYVSVIYVFLTLFTLLLHIYSLITRNFLIRRHKQVLISLRRRNVDDVGNDNILQDVIKIKLFESVFNLLT